MLCDHTLHSNALEIQTDSIHTQTTYHGETMDLLGELFIEIIGAIAEVIGEEFAQAVDNELSCKSSFKRILIAVVLGLLCWAIIGALGFATYVLFVNSHPVAGFFVAMATFFFLILFISVIAKLNQIKKKK